MINAYNLNLHIIFVISYASELLSLISNSNDDNFVFFYIPHTSTVVQNSREIVQYYKKNVYIKTMTGRKTIALEYQLH